MSPTLLQLRNTLTKEGLQTFERQWQHPQCPRKDCRWLGPSGAKFCPECGARIWKDFDLAHPLRKAWLRFCWWLGSVAQ